LDVENFSAAVSVTIGFGHLAGDEPANQSPLLNAFLRARSKPETNGRSACAGPIITLGTSSGRYVWDCRYDSHSSLMELKPMSDVELVDSEQQHRNREPPAAMIAAD